MHGLYAKVGCSPFHRKFLPILLTGLLSDELQGVSRSELEAQEATLRILLCVFSLGTLLFIAFQSSLFPNRELERNKIYCRLSVNQNLSNHRNLKQPESLLTFTQYLTSPHLCRVTEGLLYVEGSVSLAAPVYRFCVSHRKSSIILVGPLDLLPVAWFVPGSSSLEMDGAECAPHPHPRPHVREESSRCSSLSFTHHLSKTFRNIFCNETLN